MKPEIDVSRETMERFEHFSALITKWNPKINLIASVDDLWSRHIEDSVQIYELSSNTETWADIGSGGGFPGIICAIMAKDNNPDQQFTFIESDSRKCTFLRTAIRELELNAKVITDRIEKTDPVSALTLSARALAPLSLLLEYAERHLHPDGVALFMKGENWQIEHKDAQDQWRYDLDVVKSKTNPAAAVLRIKDINRV